MRESVLDPPHIRQTIESSIENAQFGKFKSIGAVPGSVPAHIQFVRDFFLYSRAGRLTRDVLHDDDIFFMYRKPYYAN